METCKPFLLDKFKKIKLMLNICICSDVTTSYLLLDYDALSHYWENINSSFTLKENIWEVKVSGDDLVSLAGRLTQGIKEDLQQTSRKQQTSLSRYKAFYFNDTEIMLDLHNSNDFMLAALLDFYSIVRYTLERSGCIFIFNRNFLERAANANIITLLKIHRAMGIQELIDSINKLSAEYDSVKPVDYTEMIKGLSNLMEMGLVDYDKKEKYKITAKGYMIVL